MNNTCYIYDDTFIQLLNLIYTLIKKQIKPGNIQNTFYTPTLLDEIIHLKITEGSEVITKIIQEMGAYTYRVIYYVFLSLEENKELIIYYLLLNGFKYKEQVLYHRNLKCVTKAITISRYVLHEIHKYKGFIRFKELDNHVLYAEIEPVNDILYFISHHFEHRLKQEYWIIKDVKRGILSIYNKKKYYLISENNFELSTLKLSNKELEMEKLWKTFYKTIGIETRKNERCRRNFMPKKYWKYMIEMENER
ncbi:MAG: DNA metabolism protein [Bacilli bacterium]|nr:DNA metabolism protein [Bacilli bacterium]